MSKVKYISPQRFGTNKVFQQASKTATASANANVQQGNDAESQVASILQSLTGIDINSLGLRDLPVLEARKKKNGTATATAAKAGKAVSIDILTCSTRVSSFIVVGLQKKCVLTL
jgi:hypothetical protein